jgi:hypothetical protein
VNVYKAFIGSHPVAVYMVDPKQMDEEYRMIFAYLHEKHNEILNEFLEWRSTR